MFVGLETLIPPEPSLNTTGIRTVVVHSVRNEPLLLGLRRLCVWNS